MKIHTKPVTPAGLLLLSLCMIQPFMAARALEAQWQVHQVRFMFMGMSTAYTCDGIESSLRRLLISLGARDDVRAEASCSNGFKFDRIHRVKLAFAVPVPADKSDLSRELIEAGWEEVRLMSGRSGFTDNGDCELLEQFEKQVLAKFQVREQRGKLNCFPYRSSLNTARVRLTVLKAGARPVLEAEPLNSDTTIKPGADE